MNRATVDLGAQTRGKNFKRTITINIDKLANPHSALQQIHDSLINHIVNQETGQPTNGFTLLRSSDRTGRQAYTKTFTDENEFNAFKASLLAMPAIGSFLDPSNKKTNDEIIDEIINEMGRMTTHGGKRTKRRRGKKSRKGKSKKRYSRRR